jgi:protocatechuate 3,4-dioxygenase, alpha subunit
MKRTPSQTIGPFFHEALRWPDGHRVRMEKEGTPIVLSGRVFDGAGDPVADALIETWQLSPGPGLGRVESAQDGGYRIETLLPEANGGARFLDVTIFARGLLKPLRTRVYLDDEPRVRADPLLKPLAGSTRLATLIATPAAGEAQGGARAYRWDIRLQGAGETVFFAY